MKNILVTGGAGFIGSHTVVELAQAGYNPVVLDNLSNSTEAVLKGIESITKHKLSFYKQDYQDTKKLADILQKESIDGVIHFAAFKNVSDSIAHPLDYYQNNVAGFVKLLETLQNNHIANVVFSSSAAVYGDPSTDVVTEDTPCNPKSPYAWTKYMDEIILSDVIQANPSIKGVALRYFNVVGGHESALIGESLEGKPQNLLPVIIKAATAEIPALTVYGNDYPTPDGTCMRDYIHVVDLAKAHVAALDKIMQSPETGYRVYNVGTGAATSVLEFITVFETTNNVKVPYKIGQRRPGDPIAFHASVDKIKRELGWSAAKTTQDAVRDAWRWQKAA